MLRDMDGPNRSLADVFVAAVQLLHCHHSCNMQLF
jgi:hypothetical protein